MNRNRDSPIVVLSLPRSGSTLFLRLINGSCEASFAGEPKWLMGPIISAQHDSELKRGNKKGAKFADLEDKSLFSCHFMPSSQEMINESLANCVYEIINPTFEKIWGFKEVHWGYNYNNTLIKINAIKKLFPNAKFLYISRKKEDVEKSTKLKHEKGWFLPNQVKGLSVQRENFEKLVSEGILEEITYDSICDIGSLSGIFKALGVEFDRNKAQNILNKKI